MCKAKDEDKEINQLFGINEEYLLKGNQTRSILASLMKDK